ncbi:uncharacterized protein LOC117824669 [Xyrichtys novacula]|uniref:Uncharacterized protein LOC117824669 n=1 Tax=Xyrichtys novacula TaxID=13765 RepID=A0AAV1GUV3_XYRNO|nr:uncharacterized protein LOC117824669 [Xyrichtys novacula]
MADTNLGVSATVKMILQSAAAGFAFGEAALFALDPTLTKDGVLLSAATAAAERIGSTGVGVVIMCLVFTSLLISLGCGFLLAAVVMKLGTKVGVRLPWLLGVTAGASLVVGAVGPGVLVGLLPPWIYFAAQGVLVLVVYSRSNMNDMTTALLIIFSTLYLSVVYGRTGFIAGLFSMLFTISVLYGVRQAVKGRTNIGPLSKRGCRLLEGVVFVSVFVGILGFFVGVSAGITGRGVEGEVVVMLRSVLWVAFLFGGLLGAGLGTVAMVGLGQEVSGKVAVGAAVLSSVAFRVILAASLGARSSTGGMLGATTAAGVSLGAASISANRAFASRNSALAVLGAVAGGAFLSTHDLGLKYSTPTTSELVTIILVAVVAFILGAPNSPFNTVVNLRSTGLLTGSELLQKIGMETVTGVAAPVGSGALGAAALGTAALGKLGTVGVAVAILMALVGTLTAVTEKSQTEEDDEHTD